MTRPSHHRVRLHILVSMIGVRTWRSTVLSPVPENSGTEPVLRDRSFDVAKTVAEDTLYAVVALTFSGRYKSTDWRFCACAINIKSSMCSEPTKHFWCKCHGLFVNSPVMVTVKSCLKCRSIQYNTIQYNTIQYNTIQYNTIQYNTIQYNTIQYNITLV